MALVVHFKRNGVSSSTNESQKQFRHKWGEKRRYFQLLALISVTFGDCQADLLSSFVFFFYNNQTYQRENSLQKAKMWKSYRVT